MRSHHPMIEFIGITLLFITASSPAYGYIDPGTGSLIIQGVIGAIAAVAITVKLYWHKLKLFFLRRKDQTKNKEILKDGGEEN